MLLVGPLELLLEAIANFLSRNVTRSSCFWSMEMATWLVYTYADLGAMMLTVQSSRSTSLGLELTVGLRLRIF